MLDILMNPPKRALAVSESTNTIDQLSSAPLSMETIPSVTTTTDDTKTDDKSSDDTTTDDTLKKPNINSDSPNMFRAMKLVSRLFRINGNTPTNETIKKQGSTADSAAPPPAGTA